ncbi:MAG: twin-arginine translocase subunit TatC [Gammaproteobacteria bacterium]|nr:twin-arginine translocase subunit TatC [Gammaproteobacteria bacterium]MBT8109876.1 twin-arginine translocase subunit TatC [Gammaproteobacteria bacterium]NND47034.1 twin-arginine translocase subunit TatC [Woeseiaceae bacterium]NNL44578.1 twin-arginine translocase subunit TatC [Woeseiaceae bacterium]
MDETGDNLGEGTLLSHLVELRSRLLKIAAAVILVFIGLLPFARSIFEFVSEPLRDVLPGGQMIATAVASPLLAPFKLTFYVALFIAMPVVLYQTWAFVAPGLYKKERRFALPLFASSILLFYSGIAFAYYVVFPLIFSFMTAIAPEGVEVMTDVTSYLDFIMMIVLAFGLAFEVPIAAVLIVWTGLTSVEKLAKARPYVFLGAFIVGMFLTPPDVISQTLLAVPIYLLYELGIIMARLFAPKTGDSAEEVATTDA